MLVRIAFFLCILFAGLSGCINMSGEFGSVVTPGQKSAIVNGKTTKTEILQELGDPDQIIDLGNGKQQFSYIRESIWGISGPFGGSGSSRYTEFFVVFDKDIVSASGERPTTKTPKYFK